ncbi:hypothetical protein DRO31_04675 [Candidatus Bathyarchaeota archaeon]|nr:MAG: hypothetical protein DRO31_04675 [Candidatus Bathyarchaeota archaeon]
MRLEPEERRRIYEYMRRNGYSRLTIKILMSYNPDGMDRLTVILGKGTDYDYRLLDEPDFREKEIQRFLELTKSG